MSPVPASDLRSFSTYSALTLIARLSWITDLYIAAARTPRKCTREFFSFEVRSARSNKRSLVLGCQLKYWVCDCKKLRSEQIAWFVNEKLTPAVNVEFVGREWISLQARVQQKQYRYSTSKRNEVSCCFAFTSATWENNNTRFVLRNNKNAQF